MHRSWIASFIVILTLVACASPTGAPPPSGGAAAQVSEWDQTVAAAKAEGKVVVIGGSGDEIRDALTIEFRKKYPEIEIEFSGMPGSQVPPKIGGEFTSGRALTDIVIAGTTTVIEAFVPPGYVDPVRKYITGPSSKEESSWRGGKYLFADDSQQYCMVGVAYAKAPFLYGSDFVQASEFKSYNDLLDPKWKGKIAFFDPRRAGGGLANVTFWYATPALGKDYIQKFFATQDVTISGDSSQLINWAARGEKPIAIGVGDLESVEAIRKGIPVKQIPGDTFSEGGYITSGNGAISVMRDPPHPNATKVYMDWLLSREGSYAWSKGAGFASMRADVPSDHVYDYLVPKPGVDYQDNYAEKYVKMRPDIIAYLETILPR